MKVRNSYSIFICALIALAAMPGRSAAQGFLLGGSELTSTDTKPVKVQPVVKVETPAQTTEEVTTTGSGPGFLFNGMSGGEEAPKITSDDLVDQVPAATTTTSTTTDQPIAVPASGQFQASTNYNILSANGDIVCSVPKGHPLTPKALSASKEYVKVQFSGAPNCGSTGEGWMSISGLQTQDMQIDAASSLSMRESPGSNGKYICGLGRGAKVTIIERMPGNDQYRAWVKVRAVNPPSGCPASEGWVHGEYLRANDSAIAGIPVDATAFAEPESTTEAGTTLECTSCMNSNVEALKEVVAGTLRLSRLPEWEQNRSLVQIPLIGSNGNIGPCGSHHYIPDDSYGTDAFAAPVTACVLMAVMQEWRSRYPDNEGTRIQFGDISHKTKRTWNTHKSHTDGNCVDIRPMRNGSFEDSPITHNSSGYSRALTKEFIALAKSYGASTVLFNGQKVGATPYPDHDNHMHICIYNNDKSRRTCENYRYRPDICGVR